MIKHDVSDRRLCLKQGHQRGWFAAGDGFRRALLSLSDGAFKLFAWLCLEAGRDSGRLEVTHKELAGALGKSKRAVGSYIAELEAKGMCRVEAGTNQHARTRLEICEAYWPYQTVDIASIASRAQPDQQQPDDSCVKLTQMAHADSSLVRQGGDGGQQPDNYVEAIRELFIRIGCGKRSFNEADARFAGQLHQRGVGLLTVENALLLGETRKWASWLSGGGGPPISSLRYFEPLIAEVEQSQQAFTEEYRRYLLSKSKKYATACSSRAEESRLEQRSDKDERSPPRAQGELAGAKK